MFVLLLSFPGKWLYLQRKFKNDDFMKKNPEQIAGVLKLSSINTYKSAGYGCIEQTDPLLALSMGLSLPTLPTDGRIKDM